MDKKNDTEKTLQIGSMQFVKQEIAWHIIESDLQSLYRFDAAKNDYEFNKMLDQLLDYVSKKIAMPTSSNRDSLYIVIDKKLHTIEK